MLEVLLLQLSAALDFAPVMFGPLNVAPTELSEFQPSKASSAGRRRSQPHANEHAVAQR